ncbi:MAG: right-handed parallel beta-helix repeat-containing protein [bacterium]
MLSETRPGRPLIAFLGLLLLAITFASPARAVVTVSGTISTNTVWTASPDPIYHVVSNVNVNPGVTLTIEPGVTVKFGLFTQLQVQGNLQAIGGALPATKIYFTSIRDDNLPPGGDDTNGDGNTTIPASQNWRAIMFRAGSSASHLQNCEVWFGGYSNDSAILCDGASPLIEATQVNASYYGVSCINGAAPTLRTMDVSACNSVPVAISIDSNPVFDSITFASTSDNGFDAIGILPTTLAVGANVIPVRGTTLSGTPISNLTYLLLGDIVVNSGATLTLNAGVVMKCLNSNTDLLIDGALIANGQAAADSQIVFTSLKDDNVGAPFDTNNDGSTTAPAPNDWGGLHFRTGAAGLLNWCTVRYGGLGTHDSNVRTDNVGTAVAITNCQISDAKYGLEFTGTSDPAVVSTSISNCTETPILLSVSANPTLTALTFSGNGITALGLINETVAVDSQVFKRNVAGYNNITYTLAGDLTMAAGTLLTIDPGVVIKMRDTNTAMIINGGLQAIGAPADSIIFTSWRDDNHGNPADTNSDGSATTPAASDWSWIRFTATAIDSLSNLQYAFVGYGGFRPGASWNGTIWCNSSSPSIDNCNFWTNRVAIRCDGNSAATIENNNFFNSTTVPIHVSALANPTIQNNTYGQNGHHALGLISETLSANATLPVPTAGVAQFGTPFPYFLVQGAVTVGSGSILTIDPGVILKQDSYGWIVNGGFRAEDPSGTTPIVFTDIKDDGHGGDSNVDGNASTPTNGDWPNIQFNDQSQDANCVLDGCQFWFGGQGTPAAPATMTNASPTITNCSFEFNTKGIWVQGLSNPTITNNLIRQCTWTPLVLDVLANPTLSGNVLDSNGLMAIGIIGGTLAQNGTIPQRTFAGYTNITQVLDTSLTVAFGATLTIDPGIVLKLWDGTSPFYPVGGTLTANGALVMDGTPGAPITVTSVEDDSVGNPADTNNDGSITTPAPGEWDRIVFNDVSDDATCILDNCILRYGGNGSWGAVEMYSAAPRLTNSVVELALSDGVRLQGTSSPIVTGNTFTQNGRTPIAMSLLANPTLTGNTSSGNGYEALGVIGETLAQDVTWQRRDFAGDTNREYVLLSTLTVGTAANLTLQPGLVIKPLSSVNIVVRRGLFANGGTDPDSLIVFTSTRDDFWGGDTNNDGAATSGSSQRWGTIRIEPTSLNASVQFSNCVFAYSTTSTTEGALTIQGTLSPDVTDCIFSHNINGINYTQASGDSTKGVVTGCDFFDNTAFAIKNTGLAHVVSARNCWWGDDTGPTHASNPGGLGDAITNQVEYTPFLGMGLGNDLLGDVSLNGEVHAYDASLILQHIVSPFLDPHQQVVGDVTCNAGLTAFDASEILQWVAQLIVTFPCLETAFPVHEAPIDADGTVRRGGGRAIATSGSGGWSVTLGDVPLDSGARIRIPLVLDGTGEFAAAQFTLRPDRDAVRIVSVEAGDAVGDAMFQSAIDDEGTARLAFASLGSLEAGTAAIVTVEVASTPHAAGDLAIEFGDAWIDETDIVADAQGARALPGDGTSAPAGLPTEFSLSPARPNPARAIQGTSFRFSIPSSESSARVDLSIYSVDGRRIRTLVSGTLPAGERDARWDGRDREGRRVAGGVYFYRLAAGSFVDQKKLVLLP